MAWQWSVAGTSQGSQVWASNHFHLIIAFTSFQAVAAEPCHCSSEYFISRRNMHLEFLKLLFVLACFSFADLQYIETHCLTEWAALTNSDHITKVDIPEAR